MNKREQFFYDHAGYSYDPKTETAEQGRERCAKRLAEAEQFALDEDIRFTWDQDDIDSSDFSDETPAWPLWVCVAKVLDVINGDKWRVGACLGGIDLGRDGSPGYPAQCRVVEAELALEIMDTSEDHNV